MHGWGHGWGPLGQQEQCQKNQSIIYLVWVMVFVLLYSYLLSCEVGISKIRQSSAVVDPCHSDSSLLFPLAGWLGDDCSNSYHGNTVINKHYKQRSNSRCFDCCNCSDSHVWSEATRAVNSRWFSAIFWWPKWCPGPPPPHSRPVDTHWVRHGLSSEQCSQLNGGIDSKIAPLKGEFLWFAWLIIRKSW